MTRISVLLGAALLGGCAMGTTTTFNKPYPQPSTDAGQPSETIAVPEQPVLIQPIGSGTPAEFVEAESADTIVVNVPSWPKVFGLGMRVRLEGADLPKLDGQCQAEINAARAAKAYLAELLQRGQLMITNPMREADFAIRANVTINSVNVVELLKQEQLAQQYGYGNWCN